MELFTPRNFVTESGHGMPGSQTGQSAEAEFPADVLPSLEFFQALESIAEQTISSGQEPVETVVSEGDSNPLPEVDPVQEILEGWSGVTASLPPEPVQGDSGEIILPDPSAAGMAEVKASPAPSGTLDPIDAEADAPVDLKLGEERVTTGQFIDPDLHPKKPGEHAITSLVPDDQTPPQTALKTEPDQRGDAAAQRADIAASSDSSGIASTRIKRQNQGQLATTAAPESSVVAKPEIGLREANSPASEPSASIVSNSSVDLTSGVTVQKPILPTNGTTDLSAPPPSISNEASASRPISEVGQQIAARGPIANPGSVLRQITDAVVTMRDEMVEIRLSPEELGRVRMVLTGQDRAPHLTIWAERPDVLDQMRRDKDALLQQFNDEGLADATLNFRGGDRDHQKGEAESLWLAEKSGPDQHGKFHLAGQDHAMAALPMRAGSQRVDIRM